MTRRPGICYLTFLDFPQEVANRVQIASVADAFSNLAETWLIVSHLRTSMHDVIERYGIERRVVIRSASPRWARRPLRQLLFLIYVLYLVIIVRPRVFVVREEKVAMLLSVLGRKYVFELHDISTRNIRLMPRIYKFAELFVLISEGLASTVRRMGISGRRVVTLPCGVPYRRFASAVPCIDRNMDKGEVKVLYAGRFSKWKGVDTLLRALAHLPDDYHLYMIGGYPGEDRWINELADDLTVSCKLTIIGHVPYSRIAGYLSRADVLVIPNSARQSISRKYTSPLKLFEYFASGKPVVVTDLPSMRSLVPFDLIHSSDPDNPISMAAAIERAATEYSDEVAIRRRDLALSHSWTKRCRRILGLLKWSN